MANPCGGLVLSPSNNAVCSPGFIKGAYLFETKPSAITEANAALQATWSALALSDMTARLYNLTFDNTEGAEPEIVQEDFTDGAQAVVQVQTGSDTYEMISSIGAMRSIFGEFRTGKTMYAYYYTSDNVIQGKEVTVNTIEAVEVRVYASYKPATGDATEKVVVYIQDLESWREFRNDVTPDFQAKTLSSVQGMNFTATDDTLTTLTVEARTLDKIGITDLDVVGAGQWILNNTTDPALVTVTGIVRSGYSYVLSFSAQTEADAWSLSYEEPSTSDEYYDLETIITGTFTA